jgi:hypothetical protein
LKRIGTKRYLVTFLFALSLMSLTAVLDILAGGDLQIFQKTVAPFLAQPLTLIPFALSIFFISPFPEELGWRGYVLDRLQARWNALTSSLILGMIWGYGTCHCSSSKAPTSTAREPGRRGSGNFSLGSSLCPLSSPGFTTTLGLEAGLPGEVRILIANLTDI